MALTLTNLLRTLSLRCNDVIAGIATGGTATTLVDSRLSTTFRDDDVLNGGTLVINEGGGNMQFVSDCESLPPGDFTSVTVTDNDCKVYRAKDQKKTGKWSYEFVTGSDASDQAYALATLGAAAATLYAQAQFYAPASYTGAAYILQLQTNVGGAVVSVRLTNGALAVYNHIGMAALTPAVTAFSPETWHRVEMACTASATVGTIDLWLDEQHIYSGRAMNTGATQLQRVAVGLLSTTVAEAKTVYVDDVRVDIEYIGSRTPETEKPISDYTATTGTITWVGNIVAPTANKTRYAIYDWPKVAWSREEKKQVINDAIRMMYPMWWKTVVDPTDDSGAATLTCVMNQFHYDLPADCEEVLDVSLQPLTSVEPYYREYNWSQDGGSGSKVLRLPNAGVYTTGRNIRIKYIARPMPLEDENDELQVDAAWEGWAKEYIINRALASLWLSTASPNQDNLNMNRAYDQKAEWYAAKHAMPFPVRKVVVPTDGRERDWPDRIAPFM
jgi:hypothetical protein